jgi:hypothetical protein
VHPAGKVTPSGLQLWISPEHPAARLAGILENAAMYEHQVAEERRAGRPEPITGDFEITTAVFDSGGMCRFVVNIVLPEAVVDRIAGWEELRPCR